MALDSQMILFWFHWHQFLIPEPLARGGDAAQKKSREKSCASLTSQPPGRHRSRNVIVVVSESKNMVSHIPGSVSFFPLCIAQVTYITCWIHLMMNQCCSDVIRNWYIWHIICNIFKSLRLMRRPLCTQNYEYTFISQNPGGGGCHVSVGVGRCG